MKEREPKSTDYVAFIKDKHERLFNAPHEIIEDTIFKATGSRIAGKDRIIKGESHEVHSITTENGQEVIIRIGHNDWDAGSFQKEKWALDQCAEIGIPVPKVLLLESLEHEGRPLSISIENKLPGTQLNEIRGIRTARNKARLERLVEKAGAILTRIHSIEPKGFGNLDAEGNGEDSSVADTLDNKWIQEDKMVKVAENVQLDPKIVLRALEILQTEKNKYQMDKPALIHSDYVPKHFLVDKDEITGIIDFENAIGGDPVKDFAYWDFFSSDQYPFESLKAGYTDKSLFGSDFERRLAMWKVFLGVNNLGYYEGEKNQGGINHCIRSLKRDIKLF
jgi:aminoglycoside phosphotransferase (APT) family kinase protein